MTGPNPEQMLAALERAGFTVLGRSRGAVRPAWPGEDENSRRCVLVPTTADPAYDGEYQEMVEGLLAALRHEARTGTAARQVLDALGQPARDDYWIAHLVDEGLCAICCNRGTFTSQVSGREMFCLCPNGRTLLTEADQTEATNA